MKKNSNNPPNKKKNLPNYLSSTTSSKGKSGTFNPSKKKKKIRKNRYQPKKEDFLIIEDDKDDEKEDILTFPLPNLYGNYGTTSQKREPPKKVFYQPPKYNYNNNTKSIPKVVSNKNSYYPPYGGGGSGGGKSYYSSYGYSSGRSTNNPNGNPKGGGFGGFYKSAFGQPQLKQNFQSKDLSLLSYNELISELELKATELCIGTENSLRAFPVSSYLPQLLNIMKINKKDNDKTRSLVLSTRILGTILRLVPKSTMVALSNPTIPTLHQVLSFKKTSNLELFEEVLKCLNLISLQDRSALFNEAGIFNEIKECMGRSSLPIHLHTAYYDFIITVFRNITPREISDKNIDPLTLMKLPDHQNLDPRILEKYLKCIGYLVDRIPSYVGKNCRAVVKSLLKIFNEGNVKNQKVILKLFTLMAYKRANLVSIFSRNFIRQLHHLLKSDLSLLVSILYLIMHCMFPNASEFHRREPMFEWFWEDDFHNNHRYDSISNETIESGYRKRSNKVKIRIRNVSYSIDLKKWKQQNPQTLLTRNIDRNPFYTCFKISTEKRRKKNKKKIENRKGIMNLIFESDLMNEILNQSISHSNPDVLVDLVNFVNLFFMNISVELLQKRSKYILNYLVKMIKKDVSIKSVLSTLITIKKTKRKEEFEKRKKVRKFFMIKFVRFGIVDLLRKKDPTWVNDQMNWIKTMELRVKIGENILNNVSEIDLDNFDIVNFNKLTSHEIILKTNFINTLLKKLESKKFEKELLNMKNKKEWIRSVASKLNELINYLESFKGLKSYLMRFPEICNLKPFNFEAAILFIYENQNLFIDPFASVGSLRSYLRAKNRRNQYYGNVVIEEEDTFDIYIEDKCVNRIYDNLCIYEMLYKCGIVDIGRSVWKRNYVIVKQERSEAEDEEFDGEEDYEDEEERLSYLDKSLLRVLKILEIFYPLVKSSKIFNNLKEEDELFINEELSMRIQSEFQSSTNKKNIDNRVANQNNIDIYVESSIDEQIIPIAFISRAFPYWIRHTLKKLPFLISFGVKQFILFYFPEKLIKRLYPPKNAFLKILANKRKINDRKSIFHEGKEILKEVAFRKGKLEIEYEKEAGIGLGPSLEFYTSLSREFQRVERGLWQCFEEVGNENDDDSSDEGIEKDDSLVHSFNGLFPVQPIHPDKFTDYFYLGRLLGKNIYDERSNLDIDFSNSFLKYFIKREELSFDADFKNDIDPVFYESVQKISKMNSDTLDVMGLCFMYKHIELIDGGKNVDVNINNRDFYCEQLMYYLINSNNLIEARKCFLDGLQEVLPLWKLQMFTLNQLKQYFVLRNSSLKWNKDELLEAFDFVNGYTKTSKQAIDLIEVLCEEFNSEDRKKFLEFVTGSRALPIGGFKSMKPRISIMQIVKPEKMNQNEILPSANTCFRKLKLPLYSRKDILKKNLIIAINYGLGSFQLT